MPHISEQEIKDAKDELKTNEVTCENVQTVDIMVFYNCLSCSKKVQFQQSSPMLRFMNCQSRFLAKNATKTTTARISVKTGDQAVWYSLFTSSLETILERYNREYGEAETIEHKDDDKLCHVFFDNSWYKTAREQH